MIRALTFKNYASFKYCITKASKMTWQRPIHLEDQNYTWPNAVECMADNEEV